MKKILIVGALLACVVPACAQQNLWKSQDIESAVVNLDHTVTFRFQAPNAQKVPSLENKRVNNSDISKTKSLIKL